MKNQRQKKYDKMNRFFVLLFVAVLLAASSVEVLASKTSSELKKTGEKIDELKEQKEAAEDQVENLEDQQNFLQGELADLNGQLLNVTEEINRLEIQITEKETEIADAQEELGAAIVVKENQYESMKKRIQYIYETGGTDLVGVLLESKSMGEMLNKAEYVEEINKYDREMLDQYQETCVQIAEKEELLKQQQAELVAMQESMEEKKAEVDSLIVRTKDSINAKENEISDAKSVVSDYDNEIAKMVAYEEELERKKAEEARKLAEQQKKAAAAKAARAAAAAAAGSGSDSTSDSSSGGSSGGSESSGGDGASSGGSDSGGGVVSGSASDSAMLAALVECEAGGESYEGQLAVASVVVNRVRSGSFPNTISGVIYQGGQFSPVASGRFAVVLARGASGSCAQAANAALSGNTNISALYFCRASSGVSGTVIGNHVFY